ncbi:MAG: UDP-N-acetylglucosamine--LPS N-acetylglucosamine transferase [Rhodobacteraceae bacterium]|nr:UDP-N-acetylglucosamine--LPS N-acetylglucosamine transferase [Paracoccaceae bacterium]
MSMRPTRVLAVASAGGHWVQLMRLAPAWNNLVVSYVSTDPGLRQDLAAEDFRVIVEANRWQKLRLLKQLVQLLLIFITVRPDAVITTGAAPGYFALRLGKLFGARTVWVDSIANAEQMSLSGQQVRKYADLWLTQWEHLSGEGGPAFLGSVI